VDGSSFCLAIFLVAYLTVHYSLIRYSKKHLFLYPVNIMGITKNYK